MIYYDDPKKTLKERMEEKDNEVFQAIKKLLNKNTNAPTIREITKAANIKSTSTTFAYLKRLKKKKVIDWEPQTWRTLRIVDENKTSSTN